MIANSEEEDEAHFGLVRVSDDDDGEDQHQHGGGRRDAARHPTIDYCVDLWNVRPGRECAVTYKKPGFTPHTRNVIFRSGRVNA